VAPIRFVFDFLSPYAYIAWKQLPAVAARHGRTIEPVPVLFAALLNAGGQKGPAEIPAKRAYIFKDCARTAAVLGLSMSPPPAHPFNPLLALRVCSLVDDLALRAAVIDGLFDAVWGGGPGVEDPAQVAAIATARGVDGAALVARAATDEAKARVRAQTEQAIADGCFGIPTMFVDGELFWGFDSFPHMERRLLGKDPADAIDFSRWANLPASAQR
jgi:2-hydroxychromene-2-carboxylate isomerase